MDGKMLVALACCLALLQIAEATPPTVAAAAKALTIPAYGRGAGNVVAGGATNVVCEMATTGTNTASYTCSPTAVASAVAAGTGPTVTRNSRFTGTTAESVDIIIKDSGTLTDTLTVTLTITPDNNAYWSQEYGYVFCISGALTAAQTIGTAAPTTPTGGTLTALTSSNAAAFTATTAGVISSVAAVAADAEVRSWSFTLTTSAGSASKTGVTNIFILDSAVCPSSGAAMITATITILLAALFNLVMKRL